MTYAVHSVRDDQLPGQVLCWRPEPSIDSEEAKQALAALAGQERATIIYYAKGLTCAEMARLTGLSARSHQRHIRRACSALDARPMELVVLAVKAGLA